MKKCDHVKENISKILVYLLRIEQPFFIMKINKKRQKSDFLVKKKNIISLGNIPREI